MVGQPGLFDLSDRYTALSAAGDPLERLATVVDSEVFCGPLIVALRRSDRSKGRRSPFDPVKMWTCNGFAPVGLLAMPLWPQTRVG